MGHSTNLRLSHVRQVFRILGDCRDSGHDRGAWIPRAVDGLRESLGMFVAVGSLLPPHPLESSVRRAVKERTFWDVGWPDERARSTWLGLVASDRIMGYVTASRAFQIRNTLSVRTRDQLVADREWRSSMEYAEDRKPLGQDDTLIAQLRLEGGALMLFSLNRAVGDRRFTPRDRRFVRLFLRELGLLAGDTLAFDDEGALASLTPRLRQVLEALAGGDSEKQVALRIGVSRHTVHDYVKELHRRFGVGSRGELIAQYHRRCRPPGR